MFIALLLAAALEPGTYSPEPARQLVRSIYEALRSVEPLPLAPNTPLLFDDLNPALSAVITRDATAEEAAEGLRRGWKRIAHGSAR